MPQNHDEYNKGLILLQELIDNTTQNDVNLCCEHGIGKLKAKLLRNKLSTEKINIYHYLKETYDPNHMIPDLRRGTLRRNRPFLSLPNLHGT